MARRVAATVIGASGLLVGLLVVPSAVSALPATPRHIGFTDDRDELRGVLLQKSSAAAAPEVARSYTLGQQTTHEGEASVRPVDEWSARRDSAFVSTRDGQPDGEVYVTSLQEFPVQEDEESTEPVTCANDATESHPVISPDGRLVAFASDLAGSWDIYVARRVEEGPTIAAAGACEGWTVTQVTDVPEDEPPVTAPDEPVDEPADDLWPAWTSDGTGLVFSSTRDDPLGDLYYLGGRRGTDPLRPLRLTDDPGADTQPAVTSFESEGEDWIAFTTTSFRPDGSLAFLPLRTDPDDVPGDFHSAWQGAPRQSSEAAWSPRPDATIEAQLAFTSTETDPAGDIWVGAVTFDNPDELPRIQSAVATVAEPGVAESHAAWREGFQVSEPVAALTVDGNSPNARVYPDSPVPVDASGSVDDLGLGLTYRFDFGDGSLPVVQRDDPDTTHAFAESEPGNPYAVTVTVTNAVGESDEATVMVTSSEPVIGRPPPFIGRPPLDVRAHESRSRAADRRGPSTTVPFASSHEAQHSAVLVYTARSHDADISEVVAADGSDRRTVVARSFEDVEFSFPYDEAGPSYTRDGEWLAYSRDHLDRGRTLVVERVDGTQVTELPAQRGSGYVDVDPAWSPDGTRIAFTRYRADGREYLSPEIWVVDFPGGQARAVTDDDAYHDTGPTWSPDGERIAFARAGTPAEGTLMRSRAEPVPPGSAQRLTVVDADDGGNVRRLRYPLPPGEKVRPVVLGDSPAWAPDGGRVAFHVQGAVRVVDLRDTDGAPGPDVPETVVADSSVTGFHGHDQSGGPTRSRPFISVAEDPAWAPDGTEIAFAGQPAGRADQRGIYAIAPDGSGLRTVAQEAGPETEPAYREPQADVSVEVVITGSPALTGEPVTATYRVTNNGPAAARKVVLTTTHTAGGDAAGSGPGCSGDGSGCASRDLDPGETFDYVVTLEHEEPVAGSARGEVSTATFDPDLADNVDEEPYEVVDETLPEADLSVDVEVDRARGWVGGRRTATVTVTNDGPDDAEDVELVMTYPTPRLTGESSEPCLEDQTACALGTIASGDEEVLELDLLLADEGRARLRAVVTTTTDDPEESNDADEVRLKVLQPVIRLLPGVGRTGQVVLAYGEKFPPRTGVMLKWNKGLIVHKGPFRVARDGTMRVPLLLVRRDRLGNRELVARSVPEEFSPVRAEVLVVARLMAAPQFLTRG